jgi:hypothetical protein
MLNRNRATDHLLAIIIVAAIIMMVVGPSANAQQHRLV